MAILAAGLTACENRDDYVSDVFTGPRADGYERNMAIGYARHANELDKMGDQEVAARFNLELSRATRFSARRGADAEQLVALHKRHAQAVCAVLDHEMREHIGALRGGTLEPSSMLALVAGQQHLPTLWAQYAQRIGDLLQAGVPTACASHRPENEPHLQEICDALLRGHDLDLQREYPFLRWSSALTKPDWSAADQDPWVELKYLRKKGDRRPITEDIAADITKYGDNGQHVLFVVYDPAHLIHDEEQFAEQILRRPDLRVRFVR